MVGHRHAKGGTAGLRRYPSRRGEDNVQRQANIWGLGQATKHAGETPEEEVEADTAEIARGW